MKFVCSVPLFLQPANSSSRRTLAPVRRSCNLWTQSSQRSCIGLCMVSTICIDIYMSLLDYTHFWFMNRTDKLVLKTDRYNCLSIMSSPYMQWSLGLPPPLLWWDALEISPSWLGLCSSAVFDLHPLLSTRIQSHAVRFHCPSTSSCSFPVDLF